MNISGLTIIPGVEIGNIEIPLLTQQDTISSSQNYIIPDDRVIFDATMLLIAGGGSGGRSGDTYYYSTFGGTGGGGAGGTLANVDILPNLTPGIHTIVIGAGGAVPVGQPGGTINGANSSAFGYTAVGGGGGSYYDGYGDFAGRNGGSGGGAAGGIGSELQGGKGVYPGSSFISSVRQGYDGGQGQNAGTGAGGGGATSAGQPGYQVVPKGQGGQGLYDNITGTNTLYAVGGGGGSKQLSANGAANLAVGSGGAGAYPGVYATAGQKGICVIRYRYLQKAS